MLHLISLLLAGVFLASLAAVFMPLALAALTAPFQGKLIFTAIASLFLAEKVWSVFFRMRRGAAPEKDWQTVAVGLSHVTVVYLALFDFYLRLQANRLAAAVTVFAVAVYVFAVLWRYWTFRHLGHQWANQINKELDNRFLISTGPYHWLRHPLYTSAVLESVCFPILLSSLPAAVLALVTFVPLEVQRAYCEERHLQELFGDEYAAYRRRTWAFFPLGLFGLKKNN